MVGNYCGFEFGLKKDYAMTQIQLKLILRGRGTYVSDVGESAAGNMQRIANMVDRLDATLKNIEEKIEHNKNELKQLQIEFEKPFEKEEEYVQKIARQKELEVLLSGDSKNDKEENETQEVTYARGRSR